MKTAFWCFLTLLSDEISDRKKNKFSVGEVFLLCWNKKWKIGFKELLLKKILPSDLHLTQSTGIV